MVVKGPILGVKEMFDAFVTDMLFLGKETAHFVKSSIVYLDVVVSGSAVIAVVDDPWVDRMYSLHFNY